MAEDLTRDDERFQAEVRRARSLFFVLLPITLLAIAAMWAVSSGIDSGAELTAAARDAISSLRGLIGGGD